MKAMELFAGYGGLQLATEAVFEAETPLVAEWEDAPSAVLAARFPDAENLRDVTAIDWPSLSRFHLDLIGGGSPCQDVSGAGPRLGMHEGTRSGLWSSMRDAIAELGPEWVVWENVRGALNARATSLTPELEDEAEAKKAPRLRALGRVVGDLVSLGYDVQWRGVKASDVGAPHQRFRIFVLARRQDAGPMAAQPPAPAFAYWDEGADVWTLPGESFLGDDTFTKPFPTDGFVVGGIARALPKWTAEDRPLTLPTPRAANGMERNQRVWARPADQPQNLENALATLPTPAVERVTDWGKFAPAVERWEAILGRPAPEPTEEGKNGRRLSPAFVEWMMGLPAGWVTAPELGLSRSAQLKALGNGVVPLQAEAALADMKARFLGNSQKTGLA